MNFTYYKFLFIDTIKRKSVWITWLIYLLVIIAFIIILPIASTMSVYQLWSNTTIAICQSFVGIAVAVFTSVLAINIFKNSNEEGTELIIISKPISRIKIVFSKFIMFFSFCILVNLTAVAITAFTFFIPNFEKKFYWGLVVSMFIGNLVTFALYGAIASLMTVKFAKAGIIVSNLIIALVLFTYQILAVFVFGNSAITTLTGTDKGTINTQSYILPTRQKDGSYTEKDFVGFLSTPNKEGEYLLKVKDWQGVKDYWTEQNSKENWRAIVATDIGTQLSLTYSCVGVNGYSDRQAARMYNFSRYYSYDLTQPASPEYYEIETPLKFVYSGQNNWGIGDFTFVFPASYTYPGVRSTKASYLKGTVTDVIPIADLKGKDLLAHYDVPFEKEQWQKYGPLFDKMYDKIFNYDIVDGNGNNHYYSNYLTSKKTNFELNNIWCENTDNVQKYYRLVWACLTGHHSDNEYFGSGDNDPLKGYTIDDFDIKSPFDLNSRFLQFKDYCFYKVYEEQHNLMINGVNDTQWAKEGTSYTAAKTAMETALSSYGMTCHGDGIGDRGFVLRATPDGESIYIQPSTQTINLTLMSYTRTGTKNTLQAQGYTIDSPEWIDSAVNGSYAKWIRTSSIISNSVYANEEYLFSSIETPERNDTWFSEQYLTRENWVPYYTNYMAAEAGIYYPYGQNLHLSMFESKSRVQFWYFAVIWGCISLAAFAGSFVIYNKYDIK